MTPTETPQNPLLNPLLADWNTPDGVPPFDRVAPEHFRTAYAHALAEHLVFLTYTDRPGIVGVVGQILGGEGINIAGMQVSRDTRGGPALIALTVDSVIPPVVLDDITATIGAVVGRTVDLDMM